MRQLIQILAAAVLILGLFTSAHAGWSDLLDQAGKQVLGSQQTEQNQSTGNSAGSLATNEIIKGLKAALDKAVDTSIDYLGKEDGFLANADVKIPVPEKLQNIATGLRLAGQGELADDFVTSMNRAAEKAVPETASILTDTISKMTIEDARNILEGADNAATEYFRKVAGDSLAARIKPIITSAMGGVDVTSYYNQFVGAAQLAGFSTTATNLEDYVTEKALDGLYLVMEREEANIRENPVARTTDILKTVFGQ